MIFTTNAGEIPDALAEKYDSSGMLDTASKDTSALDMMSIVNFVSVPNGQNPKATNLPIFHQRVLHHW